jgi:hypothetical protein
LRQAHSSAVTAGLLALSPTIPAFPVSQWHDGDRIAHHSRGGGAFGFPFHLVRGTVMDDIALGAGKDNLESGA